MPRPWTQETIDDAIDRWHQSPAISIPLHEYLNLDVVEYLWFCAHPDEFFAEEANKYKDIDIDT